MKETTIRTYLKHIRAALGWAVDQELLLAVPKIAMPKRAKGITKAMRSRPITTEEYERMLAVVPKVRKRDVAKWQWLLRGLWLSGLRISEALQLSWDEFAPVSVCMSSKYPKLRLLAEGHKAGDDRLLPMSPDFAAMLLDTPASKRQDLVFDLPIGTGHAVDVMSAIGRKAGVKVAEDKCATAHDLRRAFGTRWARRVMPAELQLLMRHTDIKTTMAYYVDIDTDAVSADLWSRFESSDTFSDTPLDGVPADSRRI